MAPCKAPGRYVTGLLTDAAGVASTPPCRLLAMPLETRRSLLAPIRLTAFLAMAFALAACVPATSEPSGVTPLEGLWDLNGQSASGSGGAIQGTWTVRSTSAIGFAGSYDVIESTSGGGQRRLTGPVTGRMAGANTTEFDVIVIGSTRRHIGTLQADTVRGSWVDVSQNGAVEATGSFRAIRRR